jgi:hypothetical protein
MQRLDKVAMVIGLAALRCGDPDAARFEAL